MGCTVSRSGSKVEVVLVPSRPLIRRRLEEILRRKPSMSLSKKELLTSGVALDDDQSLSHPCSARKSCSFADRLPAEVEKQEKEEVIHQHADNDTAAEVMIIAIDKLIEEAEGEGEKEAEEEEDDEEEEGRRIGNLNTALAFPGSPSFRVYCRNSMEDEEESQEEDGNMNLLSCDNDDPSNHVPKPLNSSEWARNRESKKDSSRRKFRRVIPRGRSMRNFLSMTSCYNPSSRQVSRHVMTAKAHPI